MLEELRRGGTNAEIAVRLGLSPETVKTHIASMLGKLDLADRHELAAWTPAPERDSLGARLALPTAFGSLTRPLPWVGAGAAALAGVAVLVVVLVALVGDGDPAPVQPTPAETLQPSPSPPDPVNQTLEFFVDCAGGASFTLEVPRDIAVRLDSDPKHRTWVTFDVSGKVVGILRSERCTGEAEVTFAEPEHSDVVHAIADSIQLREALRPYHGRWEYPPENYMRDVPSLLAPGRYRFSSRSLRIAIPDGIIALTTISVPKDEENGVHGTPESAWVLNLLLLIGNEEAEVEISLVGLLELEVKVTAPNISDEAMHLVTELVQSISRYFYV